MPREHHIPSDEAKRILHRYGLRARKGLGQHFLVDETYLDMIVEAADLSQKDTVVEVGPGLGILTGELLRSAGAVYAVELDKSLAKLLRQRLGSRQNLHIVVDDVLKVDLSQLLGAEQEYKVVANLPYYITSPVLHYFMDSAHHPSRMVVMVQREVGEAMAATPPDMSVLSVSIQMRSIPSIVAHVPSDRFYPQPKVDSVIVLLQMRSEPPVKVENPEHFMGLVRCGFSSPRKTLRNSLAHGLQKKPAEVEDLLFKADISPQRRPETLSIPEWEHLYHTLQSEGKVVLPC